MGRGRSCEPCLYVYKMGVRGEVVTLKWGGGGGGLIKGGGLCALVMGWGVVSPNNGMGAGDRGCLTQKNGM